MRTPANSITPFCHAKSLKMHAEYPRRDITALVLAGGQGRRMGGVDKGLQPYRGRTLVEWVHASLAAQSAGIWVSANRSTDTYRELGMRTLPDRRPGYPGPLAGIEAGLAACHTAYLLVSPCDTPHIPGDLGPRLWQAMQDGNAELAYACDQTRHHYLHVLLRTTLAGSLAAYLDQGGRAVRHWLGGRRVAQVGWDDDCFGNLNATEQLASAP